MTDVVQICPNDHPPFYDLCGTYAKALSALGYDVATVFFESRKRYERPFGPGEIRYRAARDAVSEIVLTDRPRFVISHRYRAYRAGCRIAPKLGSRLERHIAVAHEFGFFRRARRRWRQRLLEPETLFAGVSTAVTNDLAASLPGIQTQTICNAMDLDEEGASRMSRDEARQALEIEPDTFCVGVIGRLHKKKEPFTALEAFNRAAVTVPKAELLFLGEGEHRADLESKVGSNVRVLGFIPQAARYMPAFDVLLVASANEPFGMIFVEAMAAGIPVVSMDRPAPREVLGSLGYYGTDAASLADQLIEVQRTPAEALADREAAAEQRVQELFSVAALARRLDELLRPE